MNKIFPCSIAFVLMLSGCAYDSIRTPSLLVLNQGTIIKTEFGFLISLDSVLEDSRCPENIECVWAGNAAVRLAFFDGEFWNGFVLNTNPSFQNEIVMYGYRIKLAKLTPYPNTNVVIKQSDYKAELLIWKE